MVFASYTRWLKRSDCGDKDVYKRPICGGEKSIQCCIAKKNMENCRPGDGNMLIVDVEHIVRCRKKNKDARIDFVVFDGYSYGLIEFKYLGGALNGKEANIETHYEDFKRILIEEDNAFRENLIKEISRRFELLLDYGVIHGSWRNSLVKVKENIESKEKTNDMLWCGFYFLGNSRSINNIDLSKSNYVTKIDTKVRNTMEKYKSDMGNLEVKYQYNADVYAKDVEVITMDKSIWNV